MDDILTKFQEVVDEEIKAYEKLGELYKLKQSILIQRKVDILWDVDAQIIKEAEDIKFINQKRKNVGKYLGDENITLSAVIEKARKSNEDLAKKMENQKTKLKILSKSLVLQEKTIMTLIKHGLVMVGKTLDIIIGVISPHSKQYDQKGHNIDMDKSMISSIIEEA
jgi:hypothetical protein